MNPYSNSKINLFKTCPKQFEFSYLQKLPSESGEPAEYGIEVHHAISKFFELGVIDPDHADMIAKAERYIGDRIVQHNEAKLAVDKSLVPVDFWHDAAYVRGVIDMVVEGELIDWKTGYGDANPDQLYLYGYLYEQVHGYAPRACTVVYLRRGDVDTFEYTRELGEAAFYKLECEIKKLETTKVYRPRVGSHCAWCSFMNICTVKDLEIPQMTDSKSLLQALEQAEYHAERAKKLKSIAKDFVKETGVMAERDGKTFRPYTIETLKITDETGLREHLGELVDEYLDWDKDKIKELDGIDDFVKRGKQNRVDWRNGDDE